MYEGRQNVERYDAMHLYRNVKKVRKQISNNYISVDNSIMGHLILDTFQFNLFNT